jgi:tripartite-type tricarboxylate transporter receptor subunit TctC
MQDTETGQHACITRRHALALALATAAGVARSQPAANALFPSQPIKLIVPYPPGGNTDTLARIITAGMSRALGQSVVAENRPGASGRIGANFVALSKPDGYTLLLSSLSGHVFIAAIPPTLTFNPQTALAPVGMAAKSPIMLVVPASLGVKDLRSAIALFKSQPAIHSYGSTGIGTLNHVGPELLFQQVGADVIHVPYKGNAPVVVDLLGGRLSLSMLSPSTVAQHIRTGKLVALAVMDRERIRELPDVPTIAEAGYPQLLRFEWSPWYAVSAPAGLQPSVMDALHKALAATLIDPAATRALQGAGYSALGGTQPQAQHFIDGQFASWLPELRKMKLE